jgi:hypothetical protein
MEEIRAEIQRCSTVVAPRLRDRFLGQVTVFSVKKSDV